MRAFQEEVDSYERLNAQVLGVSADTVETHRKFAESLNLKFPLLSDPGGAIQGRYGSGRITFVIDEKGVVRYIQKGMPDNEKILEFIQKMTE